MRQPQTSELQPQTSELLRILVVALCIVSLALGDSLVWAQDASSSGNQSSAIPPDQMDSLVAPVALYPDPLLAQVLAASTYPLEIVQLGQWLDRNTNLKGQALADAVAKEPWDPSVQSLAPVPDVVKRLVGDIQWTTDLGNAFLAQEGDVMAAIQRMRKKAQDNGHLKSTEQMKVETQTADNKTVIVIQPPSQEIVYVPTYDPMVVWGAPVYPYPTGYYAAGMALSFGVGMAMGSFWGGGWGWNTGWGGGNVYINNNNNFIRNTNFGTDAGVYPHGDNAKQFFYMVKFGMTRAQAIRAATSNAADLIGRSKDVGTVEAGKYADLIAVSADPLQDVRVLENVGFVMKGGEVYKDTIATKPAR